MAPARIDPTKEFLAFFDRLKKAQSRALSEKLGQLITPKDYNRILSYFLNSENPRDIDNIYNLRPGEAYRLDKKTTGLPRTVNILCSQNGELKLIVETKSKLADNTRQKLPRAAGTFKSGKPAWRIDSEEEIEYFNLVAKLNSDHALQEMKDEAALSQHFGSDKIDVLELGKKFSKNHHGQYQTQISAYSLRAKGDLRSVLIKEQSALSEEQKDNMILNLLEGLQILEQKGIAHQDLKPQNILAYGSLTEGYRLKISDLGLARAAGDPYATAAATAGYQSPEISFYHSDPRAPHHDYFNSQFSKNSLGHSYFARSPGRFNLEKVGKPHKANDAWAMGIVLCEIRYGFRPTTPADLKNINDPLIKGLLEPDRQKRLTASEALALLQQQIQAHTAQKALAQPIAPIPRVRVAIPPVPADRNIRPVVAVPPVPLPRKKVPPPPPPRKDVPPTAAPPIHRPRVNPHEEARRKAQAEAQQRAQKKEAADNVAVHQVLDTLSKEIKFEYPERNKRKNTSTGKWIIRQMQGENKVRTKQIENITRKLLNIKENKKLTAEQKAEKAYHALSDLQAEIKTEGNFFSSALNQLCEEKKEKLAQLYPQLNAMPLHQQKDHRPPPYTRL